MDTIIIGAGLSGLSLAYHLEQNQNKNYLLFESSSDVGGLSTSMVKDGFIFDFAPHLLHLKSEEIVPLLKELLGDELVLIRRKAGIILKNKVVPYPFQYNLYHLDEETKKHCLDGAIKAANNFDKNKKPSTFDEWINMTLGEGIAKHFMVPYNQKCYGVHPKELTTDFMGRYVPSPNLEEIKQGASSDMSNLKVGYNPQFYYTKSGGIYHLPNAMVKKIQNIRLNEGITKIDIDKKKIFTKNSSYSFKNLISSIPLKKLIEFIENVPDNIKSANEKLRNNTVGMVLLGIGRTNISEYQWLYIPQEDILPYRVSFPTNWSEKMAPQNTSSISAEYSYIDKRKFTDEEIIERTINDLIKIGILKEDDEIIFKEVLELDKGFIIFDSNRNENLRLIQEYLYKNNIYSIGRFGAWEYSSMEDAILQGKKLALKLIEKDNTLFLDNKLFK